MPTSIEGSGEEIGFHPTRLYGLDADSELVQLKSHAFAPAFKRPLRRVIDGVERNCHQSANRSRIDEQSGSLLDKDRFLVFIAHRRLQSSYERVSPISRLSG